MSQENLRAEVEALKERVSKLEATIENDDSISFRGGLMRFLDDFCPSNHAERAVAIAYHREQSDEEPRFTSSDIKAAYRDAREPLPKNMSDVLNTAEENGWVVRIDETNGQQQVRQLSREGLTYVEEVFNDGST